MEFDLLRFFWQLANLIILVGIIAFLIVVPVWVYRKVNYIEALLKSIDSKLDMGNQCKQGIDK